MRPRSWSWPRHWKSQVWIINNLSFLQLLVSFNHINFYRRSFIDRSRIRSWWLIIDFSSLWSTQFLHAIIKSLYVRCQLLVIFTKILLSHHFLDIEVLNTDSFSRLLLHGSPFQLVLFLLGDSLITPCNLIDQIVRIILIQILIQKGISCSFGFIHLFLSFFWIMLWGRNVPARDRFGNSRMMVQCVRDSAGINRWLILSNSAKLAREWFLRFGTLWSFQMLLALMSRGSSLLRLVILSGPEMNISSEKLFGSLRLRLTNKLFLTNFHQRIRFLCCHYSKIRNGLDCRNIVTDTISLVKVRLWNVELVMRHSLHNSCGYLICTSCIFDIRAKRSDLALLVISQMVAFRFLGSMHFHIF